MPITCLTWSGLQDDAQNFADYIVNITTQAADLLVEADPSQASNADTYKSEANDLDSTVSDYIDVLKKVETAR